MEDNNHSSKTHRRSFLTKIAMGATAFGMSSFIAPATAHAIPAITAENDGFIDPDEWFKQIKGKHRIVFDVTRPNEVLPFAWPRVFLITNQQTGTPEKESNVVVVLRHEGIPYAMEDRLWEKYKFGEVFKVTDESTKAPSVRNMFWKPKPGDFKVPGVGNVAIGINELQDSGVMFCACEMAMTVYSAAVAQQMNQDPAVVKKDWVSGLLPGVQLVPSGVWAVGRAQEHGCAYCYAG